MPKREPLYPHIPKSKVPQFPHRPGSTPQNAAEKLWYLGEDWWYEYSTADAIVYCSADGKKRLYVYWDESKEVKPRPEGLPMPPQLKAKGYLPSTSPTPGSSIEVPFSSAGTSEIQWEKVLGEKLITITVTNISGVPQYELEIDFRNSVARISNLMTGHPLPFASAARGKLWWVATINNKTVTVEVSGIRLLTEIQLEDAFANSMARIEEKG